MSLSWPVNRNNASGMHASHWRYFNLAGLVLALAGFGLSLWVAVRYFESLPHIEDEIAYIWQARVIADTGRITTPTPVCPKCFLVPFVVDYGGLRFGKYPPGWPALLALGEKAGARALINPLLAGFSVWLTYLLGRRLFHPAAGLLAAFLTVTSPFFLINSGSLLSHAWTLLLVLGFALAWLDLFDPVERVPHRLTLVVAGLCLGVIALTRPLTAVGVALPFGFHALYLAGARRACRSPAGIGLRTPGWRGNRAVFPLAVRRDRECAAQPLYALVAL